MRLNLIFRQHFNIQVFTQHKAAIVTDNYYIARSKQQAFNCILFKEYFLTIIILLFLR